MTARSIVWVSMVLVAANLALTSAVPSAEKKQRIGKEQLVGSYKHTPGDREAFILKKDGSGTLIGGARHVGILPCRWIYNSGYRMVVIATRHLRRQYKVKLEDGKVFLYDGREVFRQGVSLNAKLKSPFDQAYLAPPDEDAEKK